MKNRPDDYPAVLRLLSRVIVFICQCSGQRVRLPPSQRRDVARIRTSEQQNCPFESWLCVSG